MRYADLSQAWDQFVSNLNKPNAELDGAIVRLRQAYFQRIPGKIWKLHRLCEMEGFKGCPFWRSCVVCTKIGATVNLNLEVWADAQEHNKPKGRKPSKTVMRLYTEVSEAVHPY